MTTKSLEVSPLVWGFLAHMTYKTSMGWGLFAPTLWFGHLCCKLDDPDKESLHSSPFLPDCIWQILPSLQMCLFRTAYVTKSLVCLTHSTSLLSQTQLLPPDLGLPVYKPVLTSCIVCPTHSTSTIKPVQYYLPTGADLTDLIQNTELETHSAHIDLMLRSISGNHDHHSQ